MLWSEDHVWITFYKTQWEKYEKGFYIFSKTHVEKTEDMTLNMSWIPPLKPLCGKIRWYVICSCIDIASLKPFMRNLVGKTHIGKRVQYS
jgi:hypothetical protein